MPEERTIIERPGNKPPLQPVVATSRQERSPGGGTNRENSAGDGQAANSKVNLAAGERFLAYRLTEQIGADEGCFGRG
jgi:hypothetical protein